VYAPLSYNKEFVMKKIVFFALAAIHAVLFFGCASTPSSQGSTSAAPPPEARQGSTIATTSPEVPYTPIDWQGASLGRGVPRWVEFVSATEKENLSKIQGLEDKELYVYNVRGGDLDLIRLNTQINAFAQIATQIKTGISVEAGNKLSGSPSEVDSKRQLVDSGAGIAANAVLSGFTLDRDFWQRLKYKADGREEIDYYAVYVIGKEDFKQRIDIELGKIEAKTQAEQEAKEAIRQAVRESKSLLE
jgi:hypothetical protein